MNRFVLWAMPGLVFGAAYALSAVFSASESAQTEAKVVRAETDYTCPLANGETTERQGNAFPVEDSRLHGCQKLSYAALGAFLRSRGVNLDLTSGAGLDTAGELYKGALDTYGVPKVDSRLNERSFHTTAAATKLFDIFIQAAPEIIANISDPSKAPDCVLDGKSSPMFDANDGSCVPDSVSCVLGRPATADDLTLCNLIIDEAAPNDANDLAMKRRIAVATLLSAGHTCE